MRFTYIKLVLYKRFPLRDAEVFEHEFTSKLLVITGPNGAGKSSLFNQLTQLPADKNDFYKGGYQEVRGEHQGKQYKFISDFRDGTSYHFIVDDEELNHSNNVTTQRELVFKHFNITQTIHDLLVGKENFTDMSLINRKKLFSAITHINIDKVLENYNQLKEELKNNELLLKNNTSLMQAEEQKLANEDHLEKLRGTQQRTKEFIEFLLNLRTELYRYKDAKGVDEAYDLFTGLQKKFKATIDKYYIPITAYPIGDLDRYKTAATSALNLVTYQLNECYTELEIKQQEIQVLGLTNQSNVEQLEVRLKDVMTAIATMRKSLFFYPEMPHNLDGIRSDIYKLESSLPDLVREIPLNPNRKFSRDRYEQLLTQKKDGLDTLTTLSTKEISLAKEIDHLAKHNDNVICPNCDHIWSLKDNATTVKNLRQELNTVLVDKIKAQDLIKVTDVQIEELVNYFTLYKQYSVLRSSTQANLKSFWEVVDSQEYIFHSPADVAVQLRNLANEILTLDEIKTYERESAEIEKNLAILATLKNTNVQQLNLYIEDLMDNATQLQTQKHAINETLAVMNKVATIYKYLTEIEKGIEASKRDLFDANVGFTITEMLDTVTSDLTKYKVILIETEKELHEYSSIQHTIERHRKIIDDLQANIKVLNIVLDELSPKNGLIAKSVSSFLNIIITNINSTIAGIWDYKMVLKAIDVESEALNYRFKVEVQDKLPIDDISKVSMGMKEIINLSFKMILYKLLDLENFPVYLDEFGLKLDKVHRSKIFDLIFKMINSTQYSQIFMITHLDVSYAMFKDATGLEI